MITRTTCRPAAAGLLLPLLLAACAGESRQPEARTAPPSAAVAQAPAVAAGSATPTPLVTGQAREEEPARVVSLTVSGGTVTGDTGRVRVPLGERVRLTVLADATDEVHVHGYDLHEETAAGTPATLEFVADQPGVFEVELEESRLLLTRLQVQ